MDRLIARLTLDVVYVLSLSAIALGCGLLWGVGAALVVGGALGALSALVVALARARSVE